MFYNLKVIQQKNDIKFSFSRKNRSDVKQEKSFFQLKLELLTENEITNSAIFCKRILILFGK